LNAIFALRRINQWRDGGAVLADIDVFEELQHLDYDPLDLYELMGNITWYKPGKDSGVDL
jgi:hypothetical protein